MKVLLFTLLLFSVYAATPPKSTGVSVYENHVLEEGVEFTQKVTIDTASGIERFQVPKHRFLDAADKLNDFKSGISVTCFRERSPPRCFMADLADVPNADPDALNLGLLQNWLADGGRMKSEEAVHKEVQWVVTGGPLNKASLRSILIDFLGDLPLYRVKPLPEGAELLEGKIEDSPAMPQRFRRQTQTFRKKCSGGIMPTTRYGVTFGGCEYITFCTAQKKCSLQHPQAGVFLECLCCPGEIKTTDCKCQHLL